MSPDATAPTLSPNSTIYTSQPQYHTQPQQQAAAASAPPPALTDLLEMLSGQPRMPDPLFQLLSGLVAHAEVTSDRVAALTEQYQELSFEVATISRVISSNQLSAVAATAANETDKYAGTAASSNATATAAAGRKSSKKATTAVESALAAESTAALHSHAVSDLESRLDHLAQRIGSLQEDVKRKTREAMDQTFSHVVGACEVERTKTEQALRESARTIEGQFVVRINDLFSEKQGRLLQTAQEAYQNLTECGHELAHSFAQTGTAFLQTATAAAAQTVSTATMACAEVVLDARDAVAEHAHTATLHTFEMESKAMFMFQKAEKMFARAAATQSASAADGVVVASALHSPADVPLPFRCCSAVEQIRALYAVLGIDGAEALRIFRSFVETPSLMRTGQASGGDAVLSQRICDSLRLVLRSPAFRCVQEGLPPLGLQVGDALPPTEGAEVVHLDPSGRAAHAGLKVGDLILRVDGMDVGPGAASNGGLHLALILAAGRPFPSSVKPILREKVTQHHHHHQQHQHLNRPVTDPALRFAPDLSSYPSALFSTSTEFGSRVEKSSPKRPDHGAVLTVYRVGSALTFSTRINLD